MSKFVQILYMYLILRPTDTELERARKAKMKDKLTWFIIKDIATYVFFLIIVARIAYSEKDPNMFQYRNDLVNKFQYSTYTDGPTLDQVLF